MVFRGGRGGALGARPRARARRADETAWGARRGVTPRGWGVVGLDARRRDATRRDGDAVRDVAHGWYATSGRTRRHVPSAAWARRRVANAACATYYASARTRRGKRDTTQRGATSRATHATRRPAEGDVPRAPVLRDAATSRRQTPRRPVHRTPRPRRRGVRRMARDAARRVLRSRRFRDEQRALATGRTRPRRQPAATRYGTVAATRATPPRIRRPRAELRCTAWLPPRHPRPTTCCGPRACT